MANPIVDSILGIIGKAADKVIPDADKREQFKITLTQLSQQGELSELNRSYDAIIAEAQSSDKWTSRARPSFMYVVYILFLTAIPYGIWYSIHPSSANNFQIGLGAFFKAIPDILYQTFGVGYVGYSAARSYDKHMDNKYKK